MVCVCVCVCMCVCNTGCGGIVWYVSVGACVGLCGLRCV